MKRSNKIFLAGLLCFSLGYIANDIVGEAGVKLAGTAMASPISQLLGSTNNRVSPILQTQRPKPIHHPNKFPPHGFCENLRTASQYLSQAAKTAGDYPYYIKLIQAEIKHVINIYNQGHLPKQDGCTTWESRGRT